MLSSITSWLLSTAQYVPLELFTFFGSFVEELIAPIPSPIVMTVTGSIAAAQQKAMLYLLILSLIGAAGKTIGAILVYVISDKAEDLVVGKLGRFIGVSHEEVENLGKKFSGGVKDFGLILFLRALPVMPSVVVSVCSGVIKLRMWMYIVGTFLGTIIRDFFYLYVGYTGIEALHGLVSGFESIESIIEVTIAILIVIAIGFIAWRRKVYKRANV